MAKGPIKHVVMFKFRPGTSKDTIDKIIAGYKALPGKIEVMKAYEWGEDVSIENLNQGFTHCFITTFEDTEGRDAYIPHPAHQEYANWLLPQLEQVIVLDFVPEVVKAWEK